MLATRKPAPRRGRIKRRSLLTVGAAGAFLLILLQGTGSTPALWRTSVDLGATAFTVQEATLRAQAGTGAPVGPLRSAGDDLTVAFPADLAVTLQNGGTTASLLKVTGTSNASGISYTVPEAQAQGLFADPRVGVKIIPLGTSSDCTPARASEASVYEGRASEAKVSMRQEVLPTSSEGAQREQEGNLCVLFTAASPLTAYEASASVSGSTALGPLQASATPWTAEVERPYDVANAAYVLTLDWDLDAPQE